MKLAVRERGLADLEKAQVPNGSLDQEAWQGGNNRPYIANIT